MKKYSKEELLKTKERLEKLNAEKAKREEAGIQKLYKIIKASDEDLLIMAINKIVEHFGDGENSTKEFYNSKLTEDYEYFHHKINEYYEYYHNIATFYREEFARLLNKDLSMITEEDVKYLVVNASKNETLPSFDKFVAREYLTKSDYHQLYDDTSDEEHEIISAIEDLTTNEEEKKEYIKEELKDVLKFLALVEGVLTLGMGSGVSLYSILTCADPSIINAFSITASWFGYILSICATFDGIGALAYNITNKVGFKRARKYFEKCGLLDEFNKFFETYEEKNKEEKGKTRTR